EAIVEGSGRGRYVRHRNEPRLRMTVLVHHADVRGHALGRQLDAVQHALATSEALSQRAFTAILEHEQVRLKPQTPIPTTLSAPRDQVRTAVEAIAHQQARLRVRLSA